MEAIRFAQRGPSMQTTLPRYAPSGAFSPVVFVYALGGLIGSVLLAGLYEFLIDLIPFIYLNALIALGFGFGVGMVGAMVIKGGHCRNRAVALVVALLIGGGGLAASYGWGYRRTLSELASQSGDATVLQLAQEVSIGTYLDARIQNGWSVRSSTIDGFGVMAIWGIEALIVLGLGLLVTMGASTEPYCEPCRAWTSNEDTKLKGLTREDAQPLLDKGDLAGVISLSDRPDADSAVRIELKRSFCPKCANTAFLSVKEVRTEVTNGKEKETQTSLIDNVELSPKLNALYIQRFPQPPEGAASAAGSAE
jgi:hypothetical protein